MTRVNPDRRTATLCGRCEDPFLRAKNTKYCSDLCRFMAKVAQSGACWIWTATLDHHGYGTFYLDGNMRAHRASLVLHGRELSDELHTDHLCRNRACVNPDHLELVTQRVNTLRGDAPSAKAWREGRCKNGHPRTAENTYVRSAKARQCRICMAASRARREGKAA